ncbi:hypothetical protein JWJ90_13540 [Desulfobulbus rhabdoformis]|uniref:hypothetical protein n=1 Tax=Desulfobulbus rhabdoformis TaxID=34032 RepID=UPI0019622A0F|nr:hypothetical protein [Desulfobulbus rhabdoformis]MBM9615302.1 hypothetical protein [Desulfobulbus rhabdoformis]
MSEYTQTGWAQLNPDTLQMASKVYPTLPSRWTTPEGATINNFSSLPTVALKALNWVPVMRAVIEDAEAYKYALVTYDKGNEYFVYEAVARDSTVLLISCKAAIDQAASATCARHLSQGNSQDLRYAEKASEIKAYLLDDDPDEADYPVMAAEAAGCGVTLAEKATEIALIRETWVTLCANVEAARIGGKKACAACADAESMIAARNAAIVTLEAL